MQVFSCQEAGNIGSPSSGLIPFPLASVSEKIMQPWFVPVREAGSPRCWWSVGRLGSGEWVSMGVKAEVILTSVLVPNIWILLGLTVLRKARLELRVCMAP